MTQRAVRVSRRRRERVGARGVDLRLFGRRRYMAQMSGGAITHADVMRSIELFGTEVVPRVRDELARRVTSAAA